jgi:hypothetical protein
MKNKNKAVSASSGITKRGVRSVTIYIRKNRKTNIEIIYE